MVSKNKEKISLSSIPAILLFTVAAISILNHYIFNIYTSTALYLNLVIALIGFASIKRIEKNKIAYILITVLYLFITLISSNGGLGSVIVYVIPLLLYFYLSKQIFNDRSLRYLRIVSIIVLIFNFAYSFKYAGNYIYYSTSSINPNTIGMYSMYMFTLQSAMSKKLNSKSRLLQILLLTITIITQYNCETRGALFATIVYLILCSLPLKIINKTTVVISTIIIILVGTIIPLVYLNMYDNNINFRLFNKSLYTGREQIWGNAIKIMKEKPDQLLLGMGSKAELREKYNLNMHNNYLAILVNFGIIGYVLYFIFIIKTISTIYDKKIIYPAHKLAMSFISTVLILGFSETTSLWSATYIFSYIGLGIATGHSSINYSETGK